MTRLTEKRRKELKIKRDKSNRASVYIQQRKDGDYQVRRINDGKPEFYYTRRDRKPTVTKKVPSYREKKVETEASKQAHEDWLDSPYIEHKSGELAPFTNRQAYSAGNYPERGLSPRDHGGGYQPQRPLQKFKTIKEKIMIDKVVPNPNYNKKKKTYTHYSDKAKFPAGWNMFSQERMKQEQMLEYLRYLND